MTNSLFLYMKTLLVLVALAACVFAETQDQETAEQYFRVHGSYPSWYTYGNTAYTGAGVRAWSYPTAAYPAAAYPATYPYAYSGYPAAAYPTAAVAGVKNFATPYAAYGYNALPYGYNTYPYGAYGAVPYVAAAPAATPVKA